MKEKILTALKTKFQGVNASILSRIAEKLAKTVTTDEQVTTAVAGVTQEFIEIIESYGDTRATEAQQSAVSNYESKHGLKDGKPVTNPEANKTVKVDNPNKQAGGDANMPEWAKQLMESNQMLSERLNSMNKERTTTTRKQQLQEVCKKLPETFRKPYERIALDNLSDEEFTTLIGEVTTEVDGLSSTLSAKGAVFGRPSAHQGGATQQGALTKEQEAAIAQRDITVTSDAQPF